MVLMAGQRAARDEVLAEALKLWGQGQQDAAVNVVKPGADEGDAGALLLICWFLHQMADPKWREAIPYAKRASDQGNPWILGFFFGHLADDPATRADAIAMVKESPTGGVNSNDPIGRAMNFANEGDAKGAAEMLRAAAGPHPSFLRLEDDEARRRVTQLNQALSDVAARREEAMHGMQAAVEDVEAVREGFGTRQKTLTELLDNLTNASSQSHFDKQATKYERESRLLWSVGVFVLMLAALAAFLPLILSYVSESHALHGQSNISAHLGATLALGAVAGVLLARARSRDRDRQRNRDLSVALGTMFAYSEQIANEDEKERFKHDMGRLVLETFLRQKPPVEDGSRSVLSEIVDSGGSSARPQAQ